VNSAEAERVRIATGGSLVVFGLLLGIFFLAIACFFWLRLGGVLSESSLDVGGGVGSRYCSPVASFFSQNLIRYVLNP